MSAQFAVPGMSTQAIPKNIIIINPFLLNTFLFVFRMIIQLSELKFIWKILRIRFTYIANLY